MSQELSPRILIAAVAIVLVIVGVIAWRMFNKPKMANVVVRSNPSAAQATKERMRAMIDQSARTAPGSYAPSSSGGQ